MTPFTLWRWKPPHFSSPATSWVSQTLHCGPCFGFSSCSAFFCLWRMSTLSRSSWYGWPCPLGHSLLRLTFSGADSVVLIQSQSSTRVSFVSVHSGIIVVAPELFRPYQGLLLCLIQPAVDWLVKAVWLEQVQWCTDGWIENGGAAFCFCTFVTQECFRSPNNFFLYLRRITQYFIN